MKELKDLIEKGNYLQAKLWIIENREGIEEIADCLLEEIENAEIDKGKKLVEDGIKNNVFALMTNGGLKVDWNNSITMPINDDHSYDVYINDNPEVSPVIHKKSFPLGNETTQCIKCGAELEHYEVYEFQDHQGKVTSKICSGCFDDLQKESDERKAGHTTTIIGHIQIGDVSKIGIHIDSGNTLADQELREKQNKSHAAIIKELDRVLPSSDNEFFEITDGGDKITAKIREESLILGDKYLLKNDQMHPDDEELAEKLKDIGYAGFTRRHELIGSAGDEVNLISIEETLCSVYDGSKMYYTRKDNLQH